MKKLSIQSAFVIPDDINLTDDELDLVMKSSIGKFHGMSSHMPNLPDEFVIALAVFDIQMKPVSVVRVAWIKVEKESAYSNITKSPIDFYNIEVVGIFIPSEFEEEVSILSNGEKVCANIIIKDVQ